MSWPLPQARLPHALIGEQSGMGAAVRSSRSFRGPRSSCDAASGAVAERRMFDSKRARARLLVLRRRSFELKLKLSVTCASLVTRARWSWLLAHLRTGTRGAASEGQVWRAGGSR
jgi:hypothetical protein